MMQKSAQATSKQPRRPREESRQDTVTLVLAVALLVLLKAHSLLIIEARRHSKVITERCNLLREICWVLCGILRSFSYDILSDGGWFMPAYVFPSCSLVSMFRINYTGKSIFLYMYVWIYQKHKKRLSFRNVVCALMQYWRIDSLIS